MTPAISRSSWGIVLVTAWMIGCGQATPGADASDESYLGSDSGTSADDEPPRLDLGSEEAVLDACASLREVAEAEVVPADIILVVDNSGSMDEETLAVQDNLNGFSSQIIQSGVDARVVLISSYPDNALGMCIEPPLGSGGCPDSDDNPPIFEHVDRVISSSDALAKVLGTYAEWAAMLRPDSVKHLVVVSDDESGLAAATFDKQFVGLHPSHANYRLHAIVSLHPCEQASAIGATYIQLAEQTGGVLADLCQQNFVPVFQAISKEVVAGAHLSCEFTIPPPPDGQSYDPEDVEVRLTTELGERTIARVERETDCPGIVDGWYYDDPAAPTKVVMCPQTCAGFEQYEQAEIQIEFGCAVAPAE